MNRRFKLYKIALKMKNSVSWQEYKKARNEVTSALRKSKASYFSNTFSEVKKTSAYWNLLNKATKSIMRKNIGPLKKEDEYYRD